MLQMFVCALKPIIYLHSNNSVDEEHQRDEQHDVGKRFKWFDKGPQQVTNRFTLAQQLHKPVQKVNVV